MGRRGCFPSPDADVRGDDRAELVETREFTHASHRPPAMGPRADTDRQVITILDKTI